MNKIKLFLCVALFGAMSFGAFSAYDYFSMSAEEKALLENVEALTFGETPGGGNKSCHCSSTYYGPNYGPTVPYTYCGTCEDGRAHKIATPDYC